MIKVDLITGFLGAGKTTFIIQYAKYLLSQGMRIAIIENDFGAINVDRLILQQAFGDDFDDAVQLEMVIGGNDLDCHRRRLKTKLITMGMTMFSWNHPEFLMWRNSLTCCTKNHWIAGIRSVM